jgi:hypothetical protein
LTKELPFEISTSPPKITIAPPYQVGAEVPVEDELTIVLLLMSTRLGSFSIETAPPDAAVQFTTQLLNIRKVPNRLWHAPPRPSVIERYI